MLPAFTPLVPAACVDDRLFSLPVLITGLATGVLALEASALAGSLDRTRAALGQHWLGRHAGRVVSIVAWAALVCLALTGAVATLNPWLFAPGVPACGLLMSVEDGKRLAVAAQQTQVVAGALTTCAVALALLGTTLTLATVRRRRSAAGGSPS